MSTDVCMCGVQMGFNRLVYVHKAGVLSTDVCMCVQACCQQTCMCVMQACCQQTCVCVRRCLEQVGRSGECANEFLALYKRLIAPAHWKVYLAVKGVLQRLGTLITQVRGSSTWSRDHFSF